MTYESILLVSSVLVLVLGMSYLSSTALSAPGKVLLSGGYLVLDRNYTGTVFALDARIHVVVEQLRKSHHHHRNDELGEDEDEDIIIVRSPQFTDAVWQYGIERCSHGGGVKAIQQGDGWV